MKWILIALLACGCAGNQQRTCYAGASATHTQGTNRTSRQINDSVSTTVYAECSL